MIFNISLTYIYNLYWSSLSGGFSYNIQAVNGNYKLKNYKNTNWTTIIAINTLRNAIKIQKYNNKLRGERDISKSVTQPNCSNYAALCNFLVTTEHETYHIFSFFNHQPLKNCSPRKSLNVGIKGDHSYQDYKISLVWNTSGLMGKQARSHLP